MVTQINVVLNPSIITEIVASLQIVKDHNRLDNLSFDNSGHTGFQRQLPTYVPNRYLKVNGSSALEWSEVISGADNIENGTPTSSLQQKATIANDKLAEFGNAKNKTDLTTRVQSSATGVAGFAEGTSTLAEGYSSHAEGQLTYAALDGAHAEGAVTAALGGSSHSEGSQTIAIANDSHAEGAGTIARGYASHVEGAGSNTESNSTVAHAEGYYTKAYGYASHAEGYLTSAFGESSHAGGSGSNVDIALKKYDDTNYAACSSNASSCMYFNTFNNLTYISGPFFTNGTQSIAHFISRYSGLLSPIICIQYGTPTTVRKRQEFSLISFHPTDSGGYLNVAGNACPESGDTVITLLFKQYSIDVFSGTAVCKDSFIQGTGLYSTQMSQAVLGKYNKNKSYTLLEIGNGNSNADRSNAFEVYKDGHCEIALMGSTDKSVPTRKYVVDENNGIKSRVSALENQIGTHGCDVIATGSMISIPYSMVQNYKTVIVYGYKENVSSPNQYCFCFMPNQLNTTTNLQFNVVAGPDNWNYRLRLNIGSNNYVYWFSDVDYSSSFNFIATKIVGVY